MFHWERNGQRWTMSMSRPSKLYRNLQWSFYFSLISCPYFSPSIFRANLPKFFLCIFTHAISAFLSLPSHKSDFSLVRPLLYILEYGDLDKNSIFFCIRTRYLNLQGFIYANIKNHEWLWVTMKFQNLPLAVVNNLQIEEYLLDYDQAFRQEDAKMIAFHYLVSIYMISLRLLA